MNGVGASGPLGPNGALAAHDPAVGAPAGYVAPIDRSDRRVRSWTGLNLTALDAERDRPYWLALASVPGIGPTSFANLIGRYGSAEAAWRAGSAALDGLSRVPPEAAATLSAMHAEGPNRLLARLNSALGEHGAVAVTAIEPAYPPSLREVDPRPPVLYVSGSLDALHGACVAVVGTRRPSGYGRAVATEIGDELARAGVTVVSGLAVGIDGEAHSAALDAGGRSVAVLPSALDRVYPPRHRALARRLVETGGALVSEVPPHRPVARPDFARRNRVIAGASQATVVVEAPDGSGALLTAAAAIDYGRDLYAVPGPIDAATSRGANRLIADHLALLVSSPVALLHQLGLRPGGRPVSVSSLSEVEGIVLAALLRRSGSIEELIERTRLHAGSVASALTLLEARELATSYAGATFHATLTARRLNRNRVGA